MKGVLQNSSPGWLTQNVSKPWIKGIQGATLGLSGAEKKQ
jgi:hypothetical protein